MNGHPDWERYLTDEILAEAIAEAALARCSVSVTDKGITLDDGLRHIDNAQDALVAARRRFTNPGEQAQGEKT